MESSLCVISVSWPEKSQATSFANALIQKKMAACVHVLPIESVYRWKENIENDSEWVSQIHTSSKRKNDIEALLQTSHPYEVPALIVLPITYTNQAYGEWVVENS